MKTLKIKESTHRKLMLTKIASGYESLDKTIDELINWYDWWKQPGSGRSKGDGNK